ncbi:MAG: DUF4391 domain-containing protein [Synergistaceae bacterium]|nr:DUF4391 domain-containing protein [Synergistaceae bacterium]
MLDLPKSTEFNKSIPKQKFYEKLNVTSQMKRFFVEQIDVIYWRNKIATSTLNLAAGKTVTEIEIFEIKLKKQPLDESVLRQMDKEIPYHIIFLLEYNGKYQAWTAYKETALTGNNAFKVGSYYHTEWLAESELALKIDGLNIDAVYESFVRQIAGESLKTGTADESLAESVAHDEKRKSLEKQIATLQAKIRKEKQLNKQVVMSTDLKRLKEELERIQ